MVKTFNPYAAHFSTIKHSAEEQSLSSSDLLYQIIDQVRAYLRNNHSQVFAQSVIDGQARQKMKKIIAEYLTPRKDAYLKGQNIEKIIESVQQEILYYGPIQKALEDPRVTNIDINSSRDVFIERDGEEEYHPEYGFNDEDHLNNVINKMLTPLGKTLTANEPHIDSIFEGFRICAVLHANKGGISTESTAVSIRKFSEETISPEKMVEYGTISSEINEFLRDVVPHANVIIAGATNSGKTTTLISFILYFPFHTRIITIEDSPEMMLRRKPAFAEYKNIIHLQTKQHENIEKRYDIAKLTKVSLRMRPWKMIIGEVRDGNAAKQAHEAMNTGHNCYLTLHSSSAKNAATRIVQLAGDGYNNESVAAQLAETVDIIIFQQKIGKLRVISEIVELTGYEGAKYPICNTIFEYQIIRKEGETNQKYIHVKTGKISEGLANKLRAGQVKEKDIIRWSSQT